MNTSQITQILSSNPYTKSKFLACTACDSIPFCEKFPYFVVVNTDEAGKRGAHWILIYVESGEYAEYFDSFGEKPNAHIERYLRNFKRLYYAPQKLQQDWSQACGVFCILFAIQRCKGRKASAIISSLKQLNPSFIESFLL